MWVRSETDSRRVIIVDALHMAYKAAFGGMPPLSATIDVGGVLTNVNTVIPTHIIKQVHRWTRGGLYPCVLCFDGRGSNRCRKAYFASISGFVQEGTDGRSGGYKGDRKAQNDVFYTSVDTTVNLLYRGGVGVLRADNYEADDLIKAAVDLAKIQYPDLPIDIITGDTDIVPLVDEQVSVFLSSRKTTYAESDDIKKNHYVQLRPHNYQSYIEGLTNYKTLTVPYNTLLLTKLLRGDKSDGISGYPKFTPTKYKNLINSMISDDVDLSSIFRYDNPQEVICYRSTGEPIPPELVGSIDNSEKSIEYKAPKCLISIVDTLSNYLDDDIISHVIQIYNGINLNGVFKEGLPETFWRHPAKLKIDVKGYEAGVLQQVLSPLRINLPLNV